MKRRALLLIAVPALAQTSKKQSAPIYRCGPGGRQLSDRPCEGDQAGNPQGFDQPSKTDRDAAAARAREDAKDAERLTRERQRLEAQPAPAPGRLDAPRAASSATPQPAKERQAGPGKKSGKKKTKKA